MGEVYKRKQVWYVDYRVNGVRKRKKVGKSKAVAVLALKDIEVKIAKKEYGFLQNETSVEVFFDKFRAYSKTNHSAATVKRYRAVIDNFSTFLADHPHIVQLDQIKPELIDLYKMYRKEVAKTRTINFELNALRTVFYLAMKWDYLRTNPVVGVKRLKVTDSKPPRFLTVKECTKLFEASPERFRCIFQTFVLTGMRLGELENLEWTEVDFRRRSIKIHRKASWQPKTANREVPINDRLLPILRRLRAANSKGLKSSYVFPHDDGGIIRIKLREKLIRIAKAAKIKNLTSIHALRHTFASQLVMSGVDLAAVQRLMGHTDIKTTMIYAHLAPSHLVDAVNSLPIEV